MIIVSALIFVASTVLWVSLFASIMRTWDAWVLPSRRRVEANRLLMLAMVTAMALAVCLRFDIQAPLYAAGWVLGLRFLFFLGLRALLKLGYRADSTDGI
ncbi:MAG: hypothetical protein NXH85_04735 [Pseudomonadaceae bacterium]|nr:hypothetical protein [Pseudomonadaceae bacterium]